MEYGMMEPSHGEWADPRSAMSDFDHAASILPLDELADLHHSTHSRASAGASLNQRDFSAPSGHSVRGPPPPARDQPGPMDAVENPESFNKILRQIRGEVAKRLNDKSGLAPPEQQVRQTSQPAANQSADLGSVASLQGLVQMDSRQNDSVAPPPPRPPSRHHSPPRIDSLDQHLVEQPTRASSSSRNRQIGSRKARVGNRDPVDAPPRWAPVAERVRKPAVPRRAPRKQQSAGDNSEPCDGLAQTVNAADHEHAALDDAYGYPHPDKMREARRAAKADGRLKTIPKEARGKGKKPQFLSESQRNELSCPKPEKLREERRAAKEEGKMKSIPKEARGKGKKPQPVVEPQAVKRRQAKHSSGDITKFMNKQKKQRQKQQSAAEATRAQQHRSKILNLERLQDQVRQQQVGTVIRGAPASTVEHKENWVGPLQMEEGCFSLDDYQLDSSQPWLQKKPRSKSANRARNQQLGHEGTQPRSASAARSRGDRVNRGKVLREGRHGNTRLSRRPLTEVVHEPAGGWCEELAGGGWQGEEDGAHCEQLQLSAQWSKTLPSYDELEQQEMQEPVAEDERTGRILRMKETTDNIKKRIDSIKAAHQESAAQLWSMRVEECDGPSLGSTLPYQEEAAYPSALSSEQGPDAAAMVVQRIYRGYLVRRTTVDTVYHVGTHPVPHSREHSRGLSEMNDDSIHYDMHSGARQAWGERADIGTSILDESYYRNAQSPDTHDMATSPIDTAEDRSPAATAECATSPIGLTVAGDGPAGTAECATSPIAPAVSEAATSPLYDGSTHAGTSPLYDGSTHAGTSPMPESAGSSPVPSVPSSPLQQPTQEETADDPRKLMQMIGAQMSLQSASALKEREDSLSSAVNVLVGDHRTHLQDMHQVFDSAMSSLHGKDSFEHQAAEGEALRDLRDEELTSAVQLAKREAEATEKSRYAGELLKVKSKLEQYFQRHLDVDSSQKEADLLLLCAQDASVGQSALDRHAQQMANQPIQLKAEFQQELRELRAEYQDQMEKMADTSQVDAVHEQLAGRCDELQKAVQQVEERESYPKLVSELEQLKEQMETTAKQNNEALGALAEQHVDDLRTRDEKSEQSTAEARKALKDEIAASCGALTQQVHDDLTKLLHETIESAAAENNNQSELLRDALESSKQEQMTTLDELISKQTAEHKSELRALLLETKAANTDQHTAAATDSKAALQGVDGRLNTLSEQMTSQMEERIESVQSAISQQQEHYKNQIKLIEQQNEQKLSSSLNAQEDKLEKSQANLESQLNTTACELQSQVNERVRQLDSKIASLGQQYNEELDHVSEANADSSHAANEQISVELREQFRQQVAEQMKAMSDEIQKMHNLKQSEVRELVEQARQDTQTMTVSCERQMGLQVATHEERLQEELTKLKAIKQSVDEERITAAAVAAEKRVEQAAAAELPPRTPPKAFTNPAATTVSKAVPQQSLSTRANWASAALANAEKEEAAAIEKAEREAAERAQALWSKAQLFPNPLIAQQDSGKAAGSGDVANVPSLGETRKMCKQIWGKEWHDAQLDVQKARKCVAAAELGGPAADKASIALAGAGKAKQPETDANGGAEEAQRKAAAKAKKAAEDAAKAAEDDAAAAEALFSDIVSLFQKESFQLPLERFIGAHLNLFSSQLVGSPEEAKARLKAFEEYDSLITAQTTEYVLKDMKPEWVESALIRLTSGDEQAALTAQLLAADDFTTFEQMMVDAHCNQHLQDSVAQSKGSLLGDPIPLDRGPVPVQPSADTHDGDQFDEVFECSSDEVDDEILCSSDEVDDEPDEDVESRLKNKLRAKAAEEEAVELKAAAEEKLARVQLEKEEAAAEEAARLEKEQAAEEEAAKLEKEQAAAAEAARLEKEQAAAEEAARLQKEEAARLAKEQAAKEEAARLEKEEAAAEEAARLEKEQAAAAEKAARLEKEQAAAAEETARLEKEQAAAAEAVELKAAAEEKLARVQLEKKQAAAEAAKLEKEEAAAEEAARLQKEQAAAEEAARLQKEDAAAAEEIARLEKEQAAAEEVAKVKAADEAVDRITNSIIVAEESEAISAVMRIKADKEGTQDPAGNRARRDGDTAAEAEAARVAAQQEEVTRAAAAKEEDARVAAVAAAAQEATRVAAAKEEDARVAAVAAAAEEATRVAAAAKEEAARVAAVAAAAEEATRVAAAQQEATRVAAAQQEAAGVTAAEEEAARLKKDLAEEEKLRAIDTITQELMSAEEDEAFRIVMQIIMSKSPLEMQELSPIKPLRVDTGGQEDNGPNDYWADANQQFCEDWSMADDWHSPKHGRDDMSPPTSPKSSTKSSPPKSPTAPTTPSSPVEHKAQASSIMGKPVSDYLNGILEDLPEVDEWADMEAPTCVAGSTLRESVQQQISDTLVEVCRDVSLETAFTGKVSIELAKRKMEEILCYQAEDNMASAEALALHELRKGDRAWCQNEAAQKSVQFEIADLLFDDLLEDCVTAMSRLMP